jgi:HlyD family secretion protein
MRQRASEDVTRLRTSLEQGLVTRNRVQQAERDLAGYEASITGQDAQVRAQRSQQNAVRQQIRARFDAVEKARAELERLTVVKRSLGDVTSTVTGRVVEIKKRVGDRVSNAEVVATIEPPAAGIEPIVYINSGNGKRIKPGMEAQVSPSTVRREEYGFMKAAIRAVGDYPVTPDAVKSVVGGNDQAVAELLGQGTKIEVHVGLTPDTHTPSGYAWSSSSGPPFKVDGGTRVMVSVVVDRKPPISYVLPIVKGALGG